MNTSHKLKDRMKELGIKPVDLARAIGASRSSLSQWLNSDVEPSAKFIPALCRELQVSPEWIVETDYSVRSPAPPPYHTGPTLRQVPLISWVAAGNWCESPDPYLPGDAEEWVPCPFDFGVGSFCLRVVGDSMFPEYREGELILVDPTIEAAHNDDVIARTPESKYTFKRLQITPDGSYLLALNPDHPERKLKFPPDSHICGVITGSWQRRKR
ncbi:MAG: S24 family peptidase [Gammaproteobacteria bacterium]|nr:S24 family peptidase [Gammaproteobacteria bacterium]